MPEKKSFRLLVSSCKSSISYIFFLIFKVILCITTIIYISLNFTSSKDPIGFTFQLTLLSIMITDLVIRFFGQQVFFNKFSNIFDLILTTILIILLILTNAISLNQAQKSFTHSFNTLLLGFILARTLLQNGRNICIMLDMKNRNVYNNDFKTDNTDLGKAKNAQENENEDKYKQFQQEIVPTVNIYFEMYEKNQEEEVQENKETQMRKMKIVNSNREKYEKFIDEFNDNDGL